MYTAQPCILLIEEQKIARETKRGREIQNTCERERKRERERESNLQNLQNGGREGVFLTLD